jgi:hypothetical protein
MLASERETGVFSRESGAMATAVAVVTAPIGFEKSNVRVCQPLTVVLSACASTDAAKPLEFSTLSRTGMPAAADQTLSVKVCALAVKGID